MLCMVVNVVALGILIRLEEKLMISADKEGTTSQLMDPKAMPFDAKRMF